MDKISVRLGEELAEQMRSAINEFRYSHESEFIREAVRHRLRELVIDRKKESAWHKLLARHGKLDKIKTLWEPKEKSHRSRLTLKDLLKYQYNSRQTKLI